MPELTNKKHEQFCQELIVHKFNQTKAYMAAYPTARASTAIVNASKLLTKANVIARVDELKVEIAKKYEISREEIVSKIKEVIARCMQGEPVKEWNKALQKFEETGEWQFKEHGALKGLELLSKLGGLVVDKTKVDAKVDANIKGDIEHKYVQIGLPEKDKQ